MSTERWVAEPWIKNFFVEALNPGFVYVIESAGKFKIGSSKTRSDRIRNAKTWLPDMTIIGVKPLWNYKEKERLLHVGNAMCWYDREWFIPYDDAFNEYFVEEFKAFSETDINRNSVDFVYWFNGSGMAEFVIEQNRQSMGLRKFQRQETGVGRDADTQKGE
jgi:hypothetical protein